MVGIIVVTYNNADHIVDCLDSIVAQLPSDGSSVVVFDNASADHTPDIIRERWPGVELIRSPENVGFARACNEAARRLATQFILLVNPDAVFEPGCIAALLNVSARWPGAGVYGGRHYTPEGELDPTCCFGRPTLWGLFCFATGLSTIFSRSRWLNTDGMGSWARDNERAVGVVSGALLLIDRSAWVRLGGFDERFFLYGEDVDLCIRSVQLGCQPMLTPGAGIVHIGGGSSSAGDKVVLIFRGKITLVRKLWHGPKRVAAEFLLAGGVCARAMCALACRSCGRPTYLGRPGRTWADLWRRRAEWRDGWPNPED